MYQYIAVLFISFMVTACSLTQPIVVPLPKKEPPATHLKKIHPNVVLVLGSGSARGFAHAGVLKALEQNHIPIDMIVGTSAGSIVGALYAGNPSATALEQLLMQTPKNQVIQISVSHIFQGPLRGDILQRYLTSHIKATSFDQLKIPLVAVATNLKTGNVHEFNSGPIAPAVNASSAAPPFFQPVELYGETYFDGGIVDPVAVDIAKKYHPKVIIAVDLAPLVSHSMSNNGAGVFMRGFSMMLAKLSNYSAAGADVIIRPNIGDVGMFDGSERKQTIDLGYQMAMNKMAAIKQLLKKNHISLNQD